MLLPRWNSKMAVEQPFQRNRKLINVFPFSGIRRSQSRSTSSSVVPLAITTVVIHVTSMSGDIYMSHALVCSELQLPHNPGYACRCTV